MFWDIFYALCTENGTTPNAVCKKLNLSNAAATHWKNGTMPKGDVLSNIADCFNCSVDYLLGRTDNPNVSGNYINGDNNVQAIKNGTVTIRQSTEKNHSCNEIEAILKKLSRADQLRAIADMIELLEEKYQKN